MKKRKYLDADTARAAAVAADVERVEARGARSGVQITDQLSPAARIAVEEFERFYGGPAGTAMVGVRCVVLDESQPQGESQPAEQTQEGE